MITINEIEKGCGNKNYLDGRNLFYFECGKKEVQRTDGVYESGYRGDIYLCPVCTTRRQMAQSFLAEINDKITSLRNEYGLEKRKFVRNNIMQRISELEELIPKIEGKKE